MTSRVKPAIGRVRSLLRTITAGLLLAATGFSQTLLTWTKMPGAAVDIGVQPSTAEPLATAASESVWVAGTDGRIAAYVPTDSTPWRSGSYNALGTRVAVDANSVPWIANTSGMWQWQFAPFQFVQQFTYASAPIDIAVGANGSVWTAVNEGPITVLYSRAAGQTTFIRNATFCPAQNCGKIDHIAVSPQGEPWILNGGSIYHLTTSGWVQVPGFLLDIAFGGDGSIWGVGGGPGNNLYYWDAPTSSWVAEGTSGCMAVSARNASEVWVVKTNNEIWRGARNNAQLITSYTSAIGGISAKLGQMTDANTAMVFAPDLVPLVTAYHAFRPQVQTIVGSGSAFQSSQTAINAAEKALNDQVSQLLAGPLAPTVGYYLKGLK